MGHSASGEQVVGRVAALWRYPVKSMAGEAMSEVDVAWHGLAGDRRWAFVREGLERSGFPWLTIRERADMWHYEPSFEDPARPDASKTIVTTPGGRRLDVVDPELAAELGHGAHVIKQNRGVFDAMPLSLITTQTVARLAEWLDLELEPKRFRPNLLVEAANGEPFQEDEWIGSELRVGGVGVRLDQRDSRCVIVNTDPASGERDPVVLKEIAKRRESCAGVYGSTVEPGRIAVGDPVTLVA
jgi:uncharacterized protein YcbX